MSKNTEETRICYGCIGDSFLQEEVRTSGEPRTCSYCKKHQESIALEELSERIHEILQKHFILMPGDEYSWERYEPVEDVIAQILLLDGMEIAEDIIEHLSHIYSYGRWHDPSKGDPYNEAYYEENEPDERNFQAYWSTFRSELRSHARFFSQYARQALDKIFGKIEALRTREGTSVIREINPTDENRYLFRARVAFSDNELEDMLKDPVRWLGPPPSSKAKAGRMNASWIPVFYGALDKETCIAEVRAPIGSKVILGRFKVIRSLRLLDFYILKKVYTDGSHFDPEYHERRGRAAFLSSLVQEISRPVMPHDEEFRYMPTQAVAEYLAGCTDPPIDGIIFRSSQIAKKGRNIFRSSQIAKKGRNIVRSSQTAKKGRNIVLFNHACGVKQYDLPEKTEFHLTWDRGTEDDSGDDIAVTEKVTPEPSEELSDESAANPTESAELRKYVTWDGEVLEEVLDEEPEQRKPALELDSKSVHVLNVDGVKYEYSKGNVLRTRKSKDEEEPYIDHDQLWDELNL